MDGPWNDYASAAPAEQQGPWQEFAQPAEKTNPALQPSGNRSFTPLIDLPDDVHGLTVPQAIEFVPVQMYRSLRDMFMAPGKAAQGEMTPEQEVEFAGNAALTMLGGSEVPRPGLGKAIGPAVKEFQDTVIAPGLQKIAAEARPPANTPEGVMAQPEVRDAIVNGPVNRDNHVPYEAGAAKGTDNTTNIDKSIPEVATVGRYTDDELRKNVTEWTTGYTGKVNMAALPTAIERFGAAIQKEETFYRGDNAQRPPLGHEAQPISVSDKAGGHSFSMAKNEALLEDMGLGDAPGAKLPLSEIIVPRGTKILDVAPFAGERSKELERMLPPGRFTKIGERTEKFSFGERQLDRQVTTYRFEPYPYVNPERSFDTATPLKIHEQVEKFVMDKLTAGGMSDEAAYRVGHWEYAERAEDAWYASQGIDPREAEAWWTERASHIEHEPTSDTPADLYAKPYPHDSVTLAHEDTVATQKPSPEEIAQAQQILGKSSEEMGGHLANFFKARELGVIGEDRPRLADGTPKEAAARAIPATRTGDDVLHGPEPGQPETDPWKARFEQFVGKLNAPADIKDLIRNAARENGDFVEARKGDIPLRDVEHIEQAAGVEPGTVDRRGIGRQLKNDNEVRLAIQGMLNATENVKAAARDVRADGSPESLIKLQEAIARRDMTVEGVVGLRAEWGRTGNVFQEFLQNVKDEKALSDFLRERGRTTGDLRDLADAIDMSDRETAARVLEKYKRTPPGWLYYTWVNNLISGPLTHAKYIAANALYLASERGLVTPLASIIGKAKELAGVDMDRTMFGETAAGMYGMLAATPHAVIAAGRSVLFGERMALRSEAMLRDALKERGEAVPAGMERRVTELQPLRPTNDLLGVIPADSALGRIVSRVIGLPGDAANGIHLAFKILNERAALESLAYREALKGGGPVAPGDVAPPRDGYVRFYHGGSDPTSGGPRWVAPDPEYARNFRAPPEGNEVHYVDIPKGDPTEVAARSWDALDEQHGTNMVGRYGNIEIPEHWAKQLRPLEANTAADPGFWARRAQIAANPTEKMLTDAVHDAYKGTFMQELGPLGKQFSSFMQKFWLGRVLFPFRHIPLNLLKATYEHTPAALASVFKEDSEIGAALRGEKGGIEQDKAVARVMVGTAVMGYFMHLYMNGQATGDLPLDPKERQKFYMSGKQPNSILIGDHWVSYARFGPAGDLAALGANFGTVAEAARSGDVDAVEKAAAHASIGAVRLLSDEVGFMSLQFLFELVTDPDRKGPQIVASEASSLMLYASGLGQTASGGDPNMRQAKTILDGIKYRIPGERETLPPKRDWNGRPIANPQFHSIMREGPARPNPVDAELVRLGVTPAPVQARIGGVKLTPALQDEYAATASPLVDRMLTATMQQPNYRAMPQRVQAETMRKLIAAGRAQARMAMFAHHPELAQQGVQAREQAILGH